MAGHVVTVNLKSGMPTVEEARARLKIELDKARSSGAAALKIIHGYGSSGVGGALRHAIRRSLRKRVKESIIRAFAAGEEWDPFDPVTQEILNACPALQRDKDLKNYNEGITVVLL
jgi:hypothetical protein